MRYSPHYLVNMIQVEGDQALAEQLRSRPEVGRLARNPAVRQAEALPASLGSSRYLWPLFTTSLAAGPAATSATEAAPTQLPYGLTYTRADEAWALGIRGQGVVVGSQDTGVEWDHPALTQRLPRLERADPDRHPCLQLV